MAHVHAVHIFTDLSKQSRSSVISKIDWRLKAKVMVAQYGPGDTCTGGFDTGVMGVTKQKFCRHT
eukprot:scaffold45547_cov18-Tisochrysis_lutea.AAC.1